jgi:hypothetical protein
MGCPPRVRVPVPHVAVVALVLCTAACSGGSPETAAAAGTAGSANAPIGITIENTYVTVENRTGAPLVEGQMEITQLGVRPPFRITMQRLENGSARDFTLGQFRMADGTLFNRTIARARNLKLTAKDVNGKTYEQEIPFE